MDTAAQVRRVARALWGQPVQTTVQPGEPRTEARAVLSLDALADPVLHLPAGADAPADLPLAMAAHAAAHLRFGGGPQARAGLRPVQQVLLGVLEDARVEWLAMQELPGLRAVWWPFHADALAQQGAGFEGLLARLSAGLFEPGRIDRHAWVQRVQRLFLAPDGRSLALTTPGQVREAASVLGNDIGQMRMPFNPRSHAVHARYRDDNSHLWWPDDSLPPSDVPLPADTAPALDQARAASAHAPSRPGAVHAEWDHRIGRYRPRWCSVYSSDQQEGPPAWSAGALTSGRRQLVRQLAGAGGSWRPGSARAVDGDELHHAALVDVALDRRAARTPDPRIHRRPWRPPPPLAVLFLLDASASCGEHGGEVLDRIQRTAATASLALQTLGHRCSLWAFSSHGRQRIDMVCLQRWDEPRPDMARLRAAGSTRLGVALRHALHLSALDARQHPGWQRVVVLLSDGEPHDLDVHDPLYLPADLQRAAREAVAMGVAVRALAFGPGQGGALPAALGRSRVRACRSSAGMPRALGQLLAARS